MKSGDFSIDLEYPSIIGILNLTPDSFYDGGSYRNESEIIARCAQMTDEGAKIIDIGGMSSRPGADLISEKEEINRLIPTIRLLKKQFPDLLISADTFRVNVASAAIQEGAVMINDISGGRWEPGILDLCAKNTAGYILMHSRNSFENMHQKQDYRDLLEEIMTDLKIQIDKAKEKGLSNLFIDPGFGFSKSIDQNFELLHHLSAFRELDLPLVVGISRKSMIWKTLDSSPEKALNGTTAINMIALMNGADFLRVHDVKEAKETITLFNELNKCIL